MLCHWLVLVKVRKWYEKSSKTSWFPAQWVCTWYCQRFCRKSHLKYKIILSFLVFQFLKIDCAWKDKIWRSWKVKRMFDLNTATNLSNCKNYALIRLDGEGKAWKFCYLVFSPSECHEFCRVTNRFCTSQDQWIWSSFGLHHWSLNCATSFESLHYLLLPTGFLIRT